MSESIKSIALFRLSAIGDVLMFLPMVRALQGSFPQAKITWIISNPAYQLVQGIEGVEFIVIDKPKTLKDYWKLYRLFQKYHFDVLLACQASMRAHLIYPMIKAKRKIGYDNIRSQEGHRFVVSEQIPFKKVHTQDGFLQFAEYLGADISQVSWDLPIDKQALAWADEKLKEVFGDSKPLVLINPAASKLERCWPAEYYPELIHYLQKTYQANVLLCGGPGALDRKLADEILAKVSIADWVGKTNLKQLMALISKAQLLICPDTGPSHMAAAVGTPVIALHGVTKPEISGPYGQLHRVVNKYPKAKSKFHPASIGHEGGDWFEKVHHPEVMQLIQCSDVIEKVDEILGVSNHCPVKEDSCFHSS
jgi:heptosyltransferase I